MHQESTPVVRACRVKAEGFKAKCLGHVYWVPGPLGCETHANRPWCRVIAQVDSGRVKRDVAGLVIRDTL